jgi:Transcriptional regulator
MHNAEGARKAILDAAEQIFADLGFDGARIDAIAEASGYNKSLIFQYFGDKLGLYAEVIRRSDAEARGLHTHAIDLIDKTMSDISYESFAQLLTEFLGEVFDFYWENPHITHILIWEMAGGWKVYKQIALLIDTSEISTAKPFLLAIQNAGLLNSNTNPMISMILAEGISMMFQAFIPMLQTFFPDEGLPKPEAVAGIRKFYVEFVTRGLLASHPES